MKYSYAPGSAAAHDRAVAELERGAAPKPPEYAILRPAQPYDLETPGTPAGLLDVARAARQGAHLPPPGGWRYDARFALAQHTAAADPGDVVASLSLRLTGDLPAGPRRAWVAYVRRVDPETGASKWAPNGAAIIDHTDADPARRGPRLIGVNELKATLRGEVYVPPPPRPGSPRLQCQTCDKVTPYSTTTWRPYTRHKCATGKEGSS